MYEFICIEMRSERMRRSVKIIEIPKAFKVA